MRNFNPVYPISPSGLDQKSLLKWAKSLLDEGATFIQYRDKKRSDKELFENTEKLLKLFENYKATLVINDRPDIAYILKAKAVHLGWGDILPQEARKLLGNKVIIGISTHNLRQVEIASNYKVNYIALGPVFKTVTKENPYPVVSEGVQKKAINLTPLSLVAIGGITPKNSAELYKRGFASLAALSVFKENPAKIFRQFKKIYENIHSDKYLNGQIL